jgi:hypothetical protein
MIFPGTLGQLHAGLARLLRWKPVGKPVQPIIAEAPGAAMMGKRLADTIIQVVWDDTAVIKKSPGKNTQSFGWASQSIAAASATRRADACGTMGGERRPLA